MSHHRIDKESACKSCKATGLYVGMAESCGAAVVCHSCKGTGKVTYSLEWDDFEGRQPRPEVKRVFQTNPGIGIGEGTNKEGETFRLEDFGGISKADWESGKGFGERGTENRAFTCPAWWYQGADYKRKPEWDECTGFGSFSACKHFKNKAACWQRFDQEGK